MQTEWLYMKKIYCNDEEEYLDKVEYDLYDDGEFLIQEYNHIDKDSMPPNLNEEYNYMY